MKLWVGVAVTFLVCTSAVATGPAQRNLSFEDRVRAQEAIERVHYKHQIGATMPFSAAVPRAVLENKVRTYLEQTAALQSSWKTAVTDHMLQRELERMDAGTRMPERLQELYAALGNDPFLIKECLARATLVDRLTRNFNGFDTTTHAIPNTVERSLPGEPVPAVELERESRVPQMMLPTRAAGGCAVDGWDNRSLDDGPEASGRSVWTGSEMLVWGGDKHGSGWRYDPAIDHWAPTSGLGAPSSRFDYRVVWTGASMIVWGGRSGDAPYAPLDTGARYDPVADAWTPTSTAGAPSPRSLHSAVWTGNTMVVWGGFGGSQVLDSGGRYDPLTDTWSPTSSVGAPSARDLHSAVWTGSTMIVFGGGDAQTGRLNTGGRYDPVSNSWTTTSIGAAPSLDSPSAVWTGTTMVVWDGFDGGRYDLASNSWLPVSTTNAPVGRRDYSVVWTGSAMVVWGGRSLSGPVSNLGARYDPVADSWTPTSAVAAPTARAAHTSVWTGQLMVVWGGYTHSIGTGFTNYLSTGGRYDPASDTWTPTATGPAGAPSPRSAHTAVWTGNQMLVWGGDEREPAGVSPLGTGGRYDPATDAWTSMAESNAPSPRVHHTAVWTGNEMIVWGGGYYDLTISNYLEFNTGGRYDPMTDSWTPTSIVGAPEVRESHTAVWTGSKMVVWGGMGDAGGGYHPPLLTGGRYDPGTDTWTPTSTSGAPSARDQHSAVWTGSAMVVWGGGYLGSAGTTGGRYDPIADTWVPTSTARAPAPRSGHKAIWTGSVMLIWGGAADSPPFDGASYDPVANAWHSMTRISQPAARFRNSAIWTGSEMVIWGGVADDPLPAGGRYDPATDRWRATTTTGAPSGRYDHSAVWTGSRMVVWGGSRSVAKLATGGTYFMDGAATDDCDGDGFTVAQGDCNDNDPSVHPAAPETCNGVDEDCDGVVDDGGDALCDTGNPCMSDTCAPQGGCVFTPKPEGTDCDDHINLCDGYYDECDGYGYCYPLFFLQCNDFYDCSLDTCVPEQGCQYAPVTAPPEVSGLFARGDKATYSWVTAYLATSYDVVRGRIDTLPVGPGVAGGEVCFGNLPGATLTDTSIPGPGDGYWYLARGKNSCDSPGTYGNRSDGSPRVTTTCP